MTLHSRQHSVLQSPSTRGPQPAQTPFYVDVGLNHGGADAEVSVNGNVVIPYSSSYPADTFDMPAGQNTLAIEVTAEDGTVQTYTFTIVVQRAGVPATPSRPTIDSVAHNSVTIAWSDPADSTITGYQVLRRIPTTHDPGHFEVIEDDTASSATSYEDTTVAPDTQYIYGVKARNVHGLSGMSGHVSTTTPADPMSIGTSTMSIPPSDAEDRRVLKSDANPLDGALIVFWDATPPAFHIRRNTLHTVEFDRYMVAWKSGAEEFQTDLDGDRVKVVMGRSSKHTVLEGLTNGTEYTVRVTHANAVGPAVHHSKTSTATPAAREGVLVSTFSQGILHSFDEQFDLRTGGGGSRFTYNQFTTGASAADLGSVTFARIEPRLDLRTQVPRNLVLELHLQEDDGGQPGDPVGVFVSPPEYVAGPAKFVAPGDGFALATSTSYWLKLVLVEGEMVMPLTMIDGLDPDSQTGWEIADACHLLVSDIWSTWVRVEACSYYSNFLVSLNSPDRLDPAPGKYQWFVSRRGE